MCLTKELLETGIDELELVGGKNASLGEMLRFLTGLGIQIPNGFVVTSVAYDYYINHNNLNNKIEEIINKTNWVVIDPGMNSLFTMLSKDGKTNFSYSKEHYLNRTNRKRIQNTISTHI